MLKFILIASLMIGAVFAEDDAKAETRSLVNDVNPDGTYSYSFETSNGIKTSGTGGSGQASGEVNYVAPDGTPISLSYTADEGGFKPKGDFVPAVPDYVLRLVEWLEAHPSDDDGSYKPDKQ